MNTLSEQARHRIEEPKWAGSIHSIPARRGVSWSYAKQGEEMFNTHITRENSDHIVAHAAATGLLAILLALSLAGCGGSSGAGGADAGAPGSSDATGPGTEFADDDYGLALTLPGEWVEDAGQNSSSGAGDYEYGIKHELRDSEVQYVDGADDSYHYELGILIEDVYSVADLTCQSWLEEAPEGTAERQIAEWFADLKRKDLDTELVFELIQVNDGTTWDELISWLPMNTPLGMDRLSCITADDLGDFSLVEIGDTQYIKYRHNTSLWFEYIHAENGYLYVFEPNAIYPENYFAAAVEEILRTAQYDPPKKAKKASSKTSKSEKTAASADTDIPDGAISWEDAGAHIGEVASVYGPVVSTHYASSSNGQPTFIDMGAEYPDPTGMNVVIWGDCRANFPAPPEDAYRGETICITGEIYVYNDGLYIEATSPTQIAVL